jgi:uncharacterized protein YndB with AHSA1/START domain
MADQPNGSTFRTERRIAASPQEVFAAFARAERLAQWWGPNGFRNTFELFEFVPGGRWVFTMHSPTGGDFRNESVFREIEPGSKVVIQHVSEPRFTLAVTLEARDGTTHLTWIQEFESSEVAARLRPIAEPANEQNLDRLQSLLGRKVA